MNLQKPKGPIEIFFSYAHEDEEWLKKLAKSLRTLQRQGLIAGWHDRTVRFAICERSTIGAGENADGASQASATA